MCRKSSGVLMSILSGGAGALPPPDGIEIAGVGSSARNNQQHSLKQRLETEHQLLGKGDQILERWEKRITLRNLRLADRFLNFELNVLLHLRVKDSSKVWVVRFEPVGRVTHKHPVGD